MPQFVSLSPLNFLKQCVFPRRKLFEQSKGGRLESYTNNHFNTFLHVQSVLHSEIYSTFENNDDVTRLPISSVQATSCVKQLHM